MKIEHYSFGTITINGRTYNSDVIIYPDKVNSSWWRKAGHNLEVSDLRDVIDAGPQVLVIGTGAMGLMRVPKETILHLESKSIEVHVEQTGRAVELFNILRSEVRHGGKERTIIAALHLTC